jgi:hypothetical protein
VDRFIVGTGRCGSTLLSRMLAECPDVLSIFEYFNGIDMARRFAREPISGADFAALVCAEPGPNDTVSRILASRPPAEPFGRYWSDQLARGTAAVSRIAPGQWCELRFEELIANPRAALARGAPPSRLEKLPPFEQETLAAACAAERRRSVPTS